MNTTEKILTVADAIEAEPERLYMATWVKTTTRGIQSGVTPLNWAGRHSECGTTFCICGWAVALSEQFEIQGPTWEIAGAQLFGLSQQAANGLFIQAASYKLNASDVVDALRRLAKVPEQERLLLTRLPDDIMNALGLKYNRYLNMRRIEGR